MEDNELRERTAKLDPEKLLSIAKEMGYDFTKEEITEVMSQELTLDDLEEAAGGRRVNPELCHQNPNGSYHDYEEIPNEERYMIWNLPRGSKILKCKYCGHMKW